MKYFVFFALILIVSCGHHDPHNVQLALAAAEKNSTELQRVIDYYVKKGDAEKLRAAYFLIGNMKDKYAYDGDAVHDFDPIFEIFDSLHKNKIPVSVNSPVIKKRWDSLISLYGAPQVNDAEVINDFEKITAEYIINDIEWSFKVKKEFPWSRHLSFEQFCEYILPYRVGNEPLELWREHLYDEFKSFRDTAKATDLLGYAATVNQKIRSYISTNRTMWQYPYDMTVSTMEKARRGACRHVVFYEANVMRANGIPVGVDYLPLWGTVDRGHEWNTLLLEDGKHFPFDAAQTPFGGILTYPYRFAKVYRKTFAPQELTFPPKTEVPKSLLDRYRIDVTNEYTKTFDIIVPLSNMPEKKKYAVICTYRTKNWDAQDWGIIKDNKAYFRNMGSNIMYIVMYFDGSNYQHAGNPFILDKEGKIHFIEPSLQKIQTLELFRKYPSFPSNDSNMVSMRGGRFQVANKANFSDSVNVAFITETPDKIKEVELHLERSYRYFRYVTPLGQKANVAEIEIYGKQNGTKEIKKLSGEIIGYPKLVRETGFSYENVFDGDLETFFTTEKKDTSWVGIDFKKPLIINKIKYCPRSDTNFILEGDTYELCYWLNGKWIAMGKKIATGQSIVYNDVPSNALYILHNLSRGNEERIFTFENGKQVWW